MASTDREVFLQLVTDLGLLIQGTNPKSSLLVVEWCHWFAVFEVLKRCTLMTDLGRWGMSNPAAVYAGKMSHLELKLTLPKQ